MSMPYKLRIIDANTVYQKKKEKKIPFWYAVKVRHANAMKPNCGMCWQISYAQSYR